MAHNLSIFYLPFVSLILETNNKGRIKKLSSDSLFPFFPLQTPSIILYNTDLSLKKHCTCVVAAIILWHVICKKLNIGKKVTGLEMMTLNHEKISMFPNLQKRCLRGSYTVYRDVLESRGRLNPFKVFFCIAHTNVLTSKYYITQQISTNRNFT